MDSQYLYFPYCRVAEADLIQSTNPKVILYIKSKETTPKFYPQHEVFKGKAEFLFTFELSQAFNDFDNNLALIDLFGKEIVSTSFKKIKTLKKQEISILCYFNVNLHNICEAVGLGKKDKQASFFNTFNDEKNKKLSHIVYLEYQLQKIKPSKKEKLIKI